MDKVRFTIITLLITFIPLLSVGMEVSSTNHIATDEDGWMRATDGDPFILFNPKGTKVSDAKYLIINLKGKNVLNRHLYMELFWANNTHGFGENKKGFYVHPFDVKSETGITAILNLEEFVEAMGEEGLHYDVLRLDLSSKITNRDFRFKCTAVLADSLPSELENTKEIALHPPYMNEHNMSWKMSKYAISKLIPDFFHKLIRDWLFLLIYTGAFAVVIFLFVYIWRYPNKQAKEQE